MCNADVGSIADRLNALEGELFGLISAALELWEQKTGCAIQEIEVEREDGYISGIDVTFSTRR